MDELLADLLHEFRRHKRLAESAMSQLADEEFFRRPAEHANCVAIVVKHLSGSFSSRWSEFLTSDGEKAGRDRDGEFVLGDADTRGRLMEAWERGWGTLYGTIDALSPADLSRSVTIRGEEHTVVQALLRGLTHAAYHVGQILYLVRLLKPESRWLTVPPGQSRAVRGAYRSKP